MKTKLIVLATLCLMLIAVFTGCNPGRAASDVGEEISEGLSKAGNGISSTVSRLESGANNTGSHIESAMDNDDNDNDDYNSSRGASSASRESSIRSEDENVSASKKAG